MEPGGAGTREGDVYLTLLRKLEREREALGGAVFDVLGHALDGAELRKLMIEAIRYGDRPEVRARLNQVVEGALDRDRLRDLLEDRALAHDVMDASAVERIRLDMERLEARNCNRISSPASSKPPLHIWGARCGSAKPAATRSAMCRRSSANTIG